MFFKSRKIKELEEKIVRLNYRLNRFKQILIEKRVFNEGDFDPFSVSLHPAISLKDLKGEIKVLKDIQNQVIDKIGYKKEYVKDVQAHTKIVKKKTKKSR